VVQPEGHGSPHHPEEEQIGSDFYSILPSLSLVAELCTLVLSATFEASGARLPPCVLGAAGGTEASLSAGASRRAALAAAVYITD